jgi:hypothetical protein
MATIKAVLEAKEEAKKILEGLPGVDGIGLTWDEKGEPCVRVNVDYEISEETRKKIPASVHGVPILTEEIGKIRAE